MVESERGAATARSMEENMGISLQPGRTGSSPEQNKVVVLEHIVREDSDVEQMDSDMEKMDSDVEHNYSDVEHNYSDGEKIDSDVEKINSDNDELERLDAGIREAQARYREAENGCKETEAMCRRSFPRAMLVAPCILMRRSGHKVTFSCQVCDGDLTKGAREEHLAGHFQEELAARNLLGNTCRLCAKQFKDHSDAVVHVAIVHKKLQEVLPLSVGGFWGRVQGIEAEAGSAGQGEELGESVQGGEAGEPGHGEEAGEPEELVQSKEAGEPGHLGNWDESPEIDIEVGQKGSDVIHEEGKVSEKEAVAKSVIMKKRKRVSDVGEVSMRTGVYGEVLVESNKFVHDSCKICGFVGPHSAFKSHLVTQHYKNNMNIKYRKAVIENSCPFCPFKAKVSRSQIYNISHSMICHIGGSHNKVLDFYKTGSDEHDGGTRSEEIKDKYTQKIKSTTNLSEVMQC